MNFAKIHTVLTIWIPVLYLYCTKLSFFSFQEEVTILGKPENNVFQQYKKKMLMTYLNCSIYMLFYNKYCVTITSRPTHRNLSWVSRWYRKTLKTDKQKNTNPRFSKNLELFSLRKFPLHILGVWPCKVKQVPCRCGLQIHRIIYVFTCTNRLLA